MEFWPQKCVKNILEMFLKMFFSRDLTLPNDSMQMTLSPSTFHGVSYRSSDWSMVDKLCILPEDDPHLESKIWDAINYGQCQCPFLQLITHSKQTESICLIRRNIRWLMISISPIVRLINGKCSSPC